MPVTEVPAIVQVVASSGASYHAPGLTVMRPAMRFPAVTSHPPIARPAGQSQVPDIVTQPTPPISIR